MKIYRRAGIVCVIFYGIILFNFTHGETHDVAHGRNNVDGILGTATSSEK